MILHCTASYEAVSEISDMNLNIIKELKKVFKNIIGLSDMKTE